jgi:hypothetical protein
MEQRLLLFLQLQLAHQALLVLAVAALLCRLQQVVQVAVCRLLLQSGHGRQVAADWHPAQQTVPAAAACCCLLC